MKPSMLQSMGSQRIRHSLATEQQTTAPMSMTGNEYWCLMRGRGKGTVHIINISMSSHHFILGRALNALPSTQYPSIQICVLGLSYPASKIFILFLPQLVILQFSSGTDDLKLAHTPE